jgi:hypothetical protein
MAVWTPNYECSFFEELLQPQSSPQPRLGENERAFFKNVTPTKATAAARMTKTMMV